jgi:hypothetical protein
MEISTILYGNGLPVPPALSREAIELQRAAGKIASAVRKGIPKGFWLNIGADVSSRLLRLIFHYRKASFEDIYTVEVNLIPGDPIDDPEFRDSLVGDVLSAITARADFRLITSRSMDFVRYSDDLGRTIAKEGTAFNPPASKQQFWAAYGTNRKGAFSDFPISGDDGMVLRVTIRVARRLLAIPNLTTQQITGLGNALIALERMPRQTLGASCRFGLFLEDKDGDSDEVRFIEFRITNVCFEITHRGYYGKAAERGSFAETGWLITIDQCACRACDPSHLRATVEELIELGAKFTVFDDSDIDLN